MALCVCTISYRMLPSSPPYQWQKKGSAHNEKRINRKTQGHASHVLFCHAPSSNCALDAGSYEQGKEGGTWKRWVAHFSGGYK